jgi:hypothetical protein
LIFQLPSIRALHTGNLSGDADDAASGSQASVAGLKGVWVASLAKVVGAGVDDDGALSALALLSRFVGPRALHLPDLGSRECRTNITGEGNLRR